MQSVSKFHPMIHFAPVAASEDLARWRVPLGWGLGLLALYLAEPEPVHLAVGVFVAAVGEALRLWASGHLEKNERLTTTGPYGWTRNPLYLGSFFLGLGFCIAARAWLFLPVLLALFVFVYQPVMRREASRLASAYPEAYPSYAASVPLFVPGRPVAGSGGRFSWERVTRNREHITLLGLAIVVAVLLWKL
jgi:protein-S-isoprenylcysteine O-methyltransferase Ste14